MSQTKTSFFERLTLFFRNRILKNTPFFATSDKDTQAEQCKINFLRIVTGLVSLIFMGISVFQSFYFYQALWVDPLHHPAPILFAFAILFSTLCFTVGLFTPLATLFLCLVNLPIEHHQQAAFYSPVIVQLLLVFFLSMNAGAHTSVDVLILNNEKHPLYAFVQFLYKILRFPDRQQIGTLYYLLFMSFGLVNLSTLIHALQYPNWASGIALQVALLHPDVSRFHFAFHALYQWSPQALGLISRLCIVFQSLFQLALIPFIHIQRRQRFLINWGLVYFSATLILSRYSDLPCLSLILWGLLFLPTQQPHPIQILFDDRCGLCHASRRTFQFLDPLNHYSWLPLSQSNAILGQYQLTQENTGKELHGLYQGKVYKGFSLYVLLSQRNPVLWIFWPFLWLTWKSGLGDRLYQRIADRRQAISQACSLTVPPEEPDAWEILPSRSPQLHGLLITILLAAQLAFLFRII